MSRGVRGLRLFGLLLRAYPRAFRERFGPEMRALFEERSSAAAPTMAGRARFWLATTADVARSASREHVTGSVSWRDSWFDVRQAWRTVSRAPLFAAGVVLIMALTIGSTTAAFSVVHAVLLRPLPFADPDQLVLIWERRGPEVPRNIVGAHEYSEWKPRARSFAGMAAIAFDRDYNLTGAGEPMQLIAARVSADFFPVMGVAPVAGRWFTALEDQPGNGLVAVIAEPLWRTRFGADVTLVGRSILLNGTPHVVVGVMPAAFDFPQGPGGAAPDVWTPIAEPIRLYRGRHYLSVVARLKPAVTIAQAQGEMDTIAAQIERELPQFSRGHGASVLPLQGEIVASYRDALLAVFGAVALVLLIGICNVANLLLARASERPQEIAIRIALGAGRFRVARQLLAEGGLLALMGGAVGMVVAAWLVALARASAPADVPRLHDAAIDPTVLLFACGVTLLTALVFGLVPLTYVLRVEVAERLKHGSKGTAKSTRQAMRRALVVAEVALTVVIAAGASLFLQSFRHLLRVDPGFNTQGILAVDLALPAQRYRGASEQRTFFDEVIAGLRGLPGVSGVAATNIVPHGGSHSGIAVAIEGQPAPAPGEERSAAYRVISADYFAALGMPILAGRGFSAQDARAAVPLIRWFPQQPRPPRANEPQSPPAAVINESMARHYFPGTDPIGRRFTVLFSPPITVVGVVRDSRNRGLAAAAGPEFYLSDAQEPQAKMTLLVRGTDETGLLPAAIRARIWAIDRDLPVSNVRTLAGIVDGNLTLYRSLTSLLSGFAAIALLLMAFGIYALVAFTTAQRKFEIGVRLALGAQRGDIRRLIVNNGVALAAAGLLAGLAGAYPLARLVSSMLYEIEPADPLTYAVLAGLVLSVTLGASWLPARRAQRVDPVTVLRNE